jgi:hypothetical protein
MDESGFSDGEERKPKDVLIPIEGQVTTLHCPKNRKIRDQTLLRCVTAAGDAYCPLLVSAQPVAREVFEYQIRDGIDLEIEITHSPYVTSEILIMFQSQLWKPIENCLAVQRNQLSSFVTIVQLTCQFLCSRSPRDMEFW